MCVLVSEREGEREGEADMLKDFFACISSIAEGGKDTGERERESREDLLQYWLPALSQHATHHRTTRTWTCSAPTQQWYSLTAVLKAPER